MTRLDRYIAGVVAAGVVAAGAMWVAGGSGALDPLVITMLVAAMAVSIWIPLRYQRSGGVEALHVNDGILLALLFVSPTAVVPILAGIGSLVGNLIRTRDPRKVAFNVGAHMLAATGAVAGFTWVGAADGPLEPRTLGALFAAAVAYNAVDMLAYGRLFALLEGAARLRLLTEIRLISVIGSYTTGILLAFMVSADRLASIFAFAFVVAVHLGYRGYAMALEERTRNENYHSVTRTLTEAVSSDGSIERFLDAMTALFGASSVELLVLTDERPIRHRLTPSGLQTTRELPGPRETLSEALRRGAAVQADGPSEDEAGDTSRSMGAPLTYHGRTIGALAVHGRRGLETQEEQELRLLGSIANDAAIALQNVQLFESVEQERSLLAEESQKLQDILDAASDGIAMVDSDGRIVAWNPAMAQLTGMETEDTLGHPWFMALRFREPSGEELPVDVAGPLQTVLNGDSVADPLDLQVLRRDGEWRWVRCTFSPVRREDGANTGVVLVARDVTRERETEEMKTDFIATVSHELRTPLTPLKGFLVTMLGAEGRIDPDEFTAFHRSMLRQVERLETLVGDLLVVSDIDRGAIRLRSQVSQVGQVVEAAISLEQPLSQSDRIRVAGSDPGELKVVGDRAAIQRIIQALLDNAVKHTEGMVEVRVTGDGERAYIEVHDSGPGIAPADQERIFQRFTRLGHHLTRATQGSGLGLSIARGLAERLGGDITVESEPGRGAVFTLSLPLAGPRPVARTDRDSATA